MVVASRIFDGKKYMWDGASHAGESQAKNAEEAYRKDGFETKTINEGANYFVYTRRVVKEVKVEGAPPA